MTEEENAKKKLTLRIDIDEKLPKDRRGRKNLGYAAILNIYHGLGLDDFFKNRARHETFKYITAWVATFSGVPARPPRVRTLTFAPHIRYIYTACFE